MKFKQLAVGSLFIATDIKRQTRSKDTKGFTLFRKIGDNRVMMVKEIGLVQLTGLTEFDSEREIVKLGVAQSKDCSSDTN